MPQRELPPGMARIEVVVNEDALREVQALLDVPTPSEAVRILISNRLAAEHGKHAQQRRPRREINPTEVVAEDVVLQKRAPSNEDWKEHRETTGERRWRKAGPPIDGEEDPSRRESPMRAYHRRMKEEEAQREQRRRNGSVSYPAGGRQRPGRVGPPQDKHERPPRGRKP